MTPLSISERALILAPLGRDAAVAAAMLIEAGIEAVPCGSLPDLVPELDKGVGFVVITEEALLTADLHPLSRWLGRQEEWSDLPFVLVTHRGGGLERNPAARRHLDVLGNVTFLERPFHPTTLVSLARSALRGRRRQYDARARMIALHESEARLARRVADALAERETALAQLHEAQKLETIGQITGGVAHDFNNLLTPITGALDILNRRYSDDDQRSARLLRNALLSADRAKTLVQRLLGFARRQSLTTAPVEVAELLEGMHDLIVSSVGAQVEVKVAAADVPPAVADINQLELAILNLCVNARDAMPNGGTLTIATSCEVAGPNTPNLSPGAYVRISVIDTGSGMDAETLAHAIEPFYSTKGLGKGTGLGLSMVHGLTAQLGGAFVISSEVGVGTRADLYLPIAEGEPRRMARQRDKALPAVQRLRLLLVDDEDLIRVGTAEMLRDLGHTVIEAPSGAQALVELEQGLEVDVLVTDYMMPLMNGAELARHARALRPGLPVLVVTGYAGGDLDIGLPQLAKPFRQVDLAVALVEVCHPNVVRMERRRQS